MVVASSDRSTVEVAWLTISVPVRTDGSPA